MIYLVLYLLFAFVLFTGENPFSCICIWFMASNSVFEEEKKENKMSSEKNAIFGTIFTNRNKILSNDLFNLFSGTHEFHTFWQTNISHRFPSMYSGPPGSQTLTNRYAIKIARAKQIRNYFHFLFPFYIGNWKTQLNNRHNKGENEEREKF